MDFITEVAHYILDKEKDNVSNVRIIVPGKRIGVFLQKALELKMETSTFFPEIIGFQEWVESKSQYTVPHPIRLQIECYSAYVKVCKEDPEELHQFLRWSSMLLNDFNEIDKNLVDAEAILSNLKSFLNIDLWSEGLTETEVNQAKLSVSHQHFWEMASDIYWTLKDNLINKNWAYGGMFLRDIAENIKTYANEEEKVYIVGFNALSKAEEQIFDYYVTNKEAVLLWDIDTDLFNDPAQETGHFLRKYYDKWSAYLPVDFRWNKSFFKSDQKNVFISGANGVINQTELANAKLESWVSEGESIDNSAVVLCDEQALVPFLNRLPDSVSMINITMGYSLQNSPVVSFVQVLFEILQNKDELYYLKSIEKLLNHPFLVFVNSDKFIKHCKRERIWRADFIEWQRILKQFDLEYLSFVFVKTINTKVILDIGFKLIKLVYDSKILVDLIFESEYLYTLHQVWHQCLDIEDEYRALVKNPMVLKRFMEGVLKKESLDFIGNPIGGLQVMGMLETRLLDFDRILFLGINEGVMPKGQSHDSLIPFELKQYHNMTTFLEKDAIYAYHFFRLLQRSKDIHFIYDTNIEGPGAANKSRFVQQIEKEWKLAQSFNVNIQYEYFEINNKPIDFLESYQKTEISRKKLLLRAEKGISASFINEYFTCPLNFYRKRVLGLREEETDEVVSYAELGTVVHDSLEAIYNQKLNQPLGIDDLLKYKKQVSTQVIKEFRKLGHDTFLNQAQNKIRIKVANEFVQNMIDLDIKTVKAQGELIIIENEKSCEVSLSIPGISVPVKLIGYIDRLDKVGDTYRIIDYKTGSVKSVSMDNFFEDLLEDRSKDFTKQFQVMFYAYLIWKLNIVPEGDVQSGLISFRNFASGYQSLKKSRKLYYPMDEIEKFEDLLVDVLKEILLGNKVYEHPESITEGCYYC